jgi:UDP-glucose 4-epimerase
MTKEKHILAGGAGFIGYNLARRLREKNHEVLIIDNFTNSVSQPLITELIELGVMVQEVDLSEAPLLPSLITEFVGDESIVLWHLAANSDIPLGIDDYRVDFNNTFLTTLNILESIKGLAVANFYFASSSAVYGDKLGKAITELDPLYPISNYGSYKAASENVISSYREHFDRIGIFRFPNVVGAPATHGVIYDFVQKLKSTPELLEVLGNGTQQKAYVHVDELIDVMLYYHHECKTINQFEVLNIGPVDAGIKVSEIAQLVASRVSPDAQIIYGDKNIGWRGDIPKFRYDVSKLKLLGWERQLSSRKAVIKAIDEIFEQLL